MLTPRIDILPAAQKRLWPELAGIPAHFTLYGGTAIALRLGHRASIDFDFFSRAPFAPQALQETMRFLDDAVVRQSEANALTRSVERDGPVKLARPANLPSLTPLHARGARK